MAKKTKPKKPRANPSVIQPEALEPLSPSPRRSWSTSVMALLIAALCAGLYAWTADFPFEYDDYCYMIDNP